MTKLHELKQVKYYAVPAGDKGFTPSCIDEAITKQYEAGLVKGGTVFEYPLGDDTTLYLCRCREHGKAKVEPARFIECLEKINGQFFNPDPVNGYSNPRIAIPKEYITVADADLVLTNLVPTYGTMPTRKDGVIFFAESTVSTQQEESDTDTPFPPPIKATPHDNVICAGCGKNSKMTGALPTSWAYCRCRNSGDWIVWDHTKKPKEVPPDDVRPYCYDCRPDVHPDIEDEWDQRAMKRVAELTNKMVVCDDCGKEFDGSKPSGHSWSGDGKHHCPECSFPKWGPDSKGTCPECNGVFYSREEYSDHRGKCSLEAAQNRKPIGEMTKGDVHQAFTEAMDKPMTMLPMGDGLPSVDNFQEAIDDLHERFNEAGKEVGDIRVTMASLQDKVGTFDAQIKGIDLMVRQGEPIMIPNLTEPLDYQASINSIESILRDMVMVSTEKHDYEICHEALAMLTDGLERLRTKVIGGD